MNIYKVPHDGTTSAASPYVFQGMMNRIDRIFMDSKRFLETDGGCKGGVQRGRDKNGAAISGE